MKPRIADTIASRAKRRRANAVLTVPVAAALCALGIHWFVATNEPPLKRRSYFDFSRALLGGGALLAGRATLVLGCCRAGCGDMCPIFAAAFWLLCVWELITSGFRLLPLPYFPEPGRRAAKSDQ